MATSQASAGPIGRGVDLENLTFDLRALPYTFWWMLGQARSKCEHISKAPLSPQKWDDLHVIYLIRGVHSTTAIEGNTLTEDEVLRIYRDELTLPPSRQYLGQEVLNILAAIGSSISIDKARSPLTIDEVNAFNSVVLQHLSVEPHVTPGAFRDVSVTAGRYVCPPPQRVAHLMSVFVGWYNAFPDVLSGFDKISTAIIKAVATHLYFVLIHPYGDGNGRTARLLEWRTLDAAGIATPATHLLSNHYNLTRTRYYQMLDRASSGGDTAPFFEYAIEGFRDQLDEQLTHFHSQYNDLVYSELVRSSTLGTSHDLVMRRQELAMAICAVPEFVPRSHVRTLTPSLAQKYATCTEKTISRDLSALETAGLIKMMPLGWSAITKEIYWRHRRDVEPART